MNTPIARISDEKPFYFSAEKLAYWFFRLNGCLFLENFLVHHEIRTKGNSTEVDLLSVRFPYRQELKLTGAAMPDHKVFGNDKIEIIFAEVKSNQPCSINASWLNSQGGNMERMLYIVGAIPENEVNKAAKSLYQHHVYENATCRIRLFAIGSEENANLAKGIIQLDWTDVLFFIHKRFSGYRKFKTEHNNWDDTGSNLFELSKIHKRDSFIQTVKGNLTK